MIKTSNISTEKRNIGTTMIDQVSTLEMVKMINNQDKQVALAVEKEISSIASAIDAGHASLKNGGRIIYFGAGTSGRLGILDASEIFPTFGEKEMFVGLIAGGQQAIQFPVENAEDDEQQIIKDFKKINVTRHDLLIGIAASGRTPYVVAGLRYANQIGANSVAISTAKESEIGKIANIKIEAFVGAEAITGSTRMKSGTAQKMILNMISTGIMVKYGKTYSNLMVDVKPTNKKLIARAVDMLKTISGVSDERALELLKVTDYNVKVAAVVHKKNISPQEANNLLDINDNKLREIIE